MQLYEISLNIFVVALSLFLAGIGCFFIFLISDIIIERYLSCKILSYFLSVGITILIIFLVI